MATKTANPVLPAETTAGKRLTCDAEPLHEALTPAKSKGMGCLYCPVLPTVKGVQIGADYKGGGKDHEKKVHSHRMKGNGPEDARVLIVLEAPTRKEDQQGEAFIGSDAGWIKRALGNAGIDHRTVRATYAVRCCTFKPTDTTLKACNGYLRNEIERIDPEVIVPIGAAALKAVVGPEYRIMSCAGTAFRRRVAGKRRVVFPMLSPAYIRVNDVQAGDWQDAWNRLGALLDGDEQVLDGLGVYKEITSAEEAARMLDAITEGDCSTDLETNTLDPREGVVAAYDLIEAAGQPLKVELREKAQKARIAVVAWSTKPGEGFFVLRHHAEGAWTKDDRAVFDAAYKRLLLRKTVRKIFWNAAFEQTWFLVHYGILARNYLDGMLVHHQHGEERGHGLDEAAQQYTGMGAWTDAIKPYQKALNYNMSLVPKRIIGKYAGADVDAALRVTLRLLPELDKRRRRLVRVFYPRLIDEIARMQANGQMGSMEAAKLFERFTRYSTKVAEDKLLALPVVRRYVRRKRREDPNQGKSNEWRLNFGSPQQLREILFDELGYEPFAVSKKTNTPKTDKESLNHFVKAHKCEFCEALLEWRKYEKQHGTYALKIIEQMKRFDGFIRGHFKPHGTVTGRLASSDPNLQNQPDAARRMYVSQFGDEGCIVQIDYSQIEVRVAACLSNDPLLLEVYRKGEDVHTATMMRMFKISREKAADMEKNKPKKFKRLRTIAKRIVFGVIYGIGPDGIVRTCRKEGIEVTFEEAQEYIARFFKIYKRLRKWIDEIIAYIHKKGYTLSPFARRRHLPDIWSDTSTDEGRSKVRRAERQGPNAIIQGAASDLTTTSIMLIGKELRRRKFKSRITMTVHDSIIFDCLRSEAAEVVRIAKDIMEHLPERSAEIWGSDFDWSWIRCPIVAEAEVGLNWRDAVKFDPTGANPKAEKDIVAALKKAAQVQDENDQKMRTATQELKKRAA